ncbi:scavenger receptor class F member 1-like [Haliotis cracherodii]|uniref:scavenger receptor class F member 1-like n=1 Tax=Haliotis cracherodii TaxID=6455 RepID=UPI0039EB4895
MTVMATTFLLALLAVELSMAIFCPPENHCADDVCHNTGFCKHGCEEGWNGPKCDTQTVCPNCQWGHCNKARVCISGCLGGFYGDTCNKTCHVHCKNKCDFKTGVCLGGCTPGWYGPYCGDKCGEGCIQNSCHRWLGKCQCRSGRFTERCNQECFGCLGRVCDHHDGRCRRGCRSGWTGAACSTNMCVNCVNSACPSWTSGARCHGCVSGYRGRTCEVKCADNCAICSQFGNTCSECKLGSSCITVPTTKVSSTVTSYGVSSSNNTVTSESKTPVPNTGRSNVVQHEATGWDAYSSSAIRRTSFIFACILLAFGLFLTAWCAQQTWYVGCLNKGRLSQMKPNKRTGLDYIYSVNNAQRHSQSGLTHLQEADVYYDGIHTSLGDIRTQRDGRYRDIPVRYESLRYTHSINYNDLQ